MRDEIKTELDDMMVQGIIRRVNEPTEWINILVYIRKRNGRFRLCLDPKDLNRAIMQHHHKTPKMKEFARKHSNAKYFSKLDAKNGYYK